jgi:hypothetical protein
MKYGNHDVTGVSGGRILDHLKSAAYRQGREDALEEAARELEALAAHYDSAIYFSGYATYRAAAQRIRALKGEK